MSRKYLQLVQAILFTSNIAAQVPPAPVMALPIQAPAVSNVMITFDAPQCGQPASVCGLSSCTCWWWLWRAKCSSITSCPAPSTSTYTNMTNAVQVSTADNGRGGTHYVAQDTDAALQPGTIWQYFVNVNWASISPITYGPASNASGGLIIPAAQGVPWKVYLNYQNVQCITGNPCNVAVWRATCVSTANCVPSFPDAYIQITTTTTQTVSSTGTTFQSVDAGTTVPLANATVYNYAVSNAFTANPSNSSNTTSVVITTPKGVHNAVLNFSNAACRTASPCTLQVYRATCTSTASCPAYAPGSSSWKALNMSSGLVPTTGTQGTSWVYTDNDAALVEYTTYVYVATNSYTGATTASSPSQQFVGTTTVGKSKEKK